MYLDLFKHSWRPFACHIILTCTFILFDKTQYQTLFIYLFISIFIYCNIRLRYFFGMNIASTPLFPLLPQGGSSDSTAAQGRRRMRRATQMVRFAVFKLRAA